MQDGLWTEPHVHMTSEVYTEKNKEHLQWLKFQWKAQQCCGSFKTISNALLIWTPAKFNAGLLIEIIWEGNPVTETDWLIHNETKITKKTVISTNNDASKEIISSPWIKNKTEIQPEY